MPAARAELLLFCRYRSLFTLERSGLCTVVIAYDTASREQVAIKLIPDLVLRDAAAGEALRRAVLRGSTLWHPSIAQVFAFEREGENAAVVVEWIDGETLAAKLTHQPGRCFEARQIRGWIEQTADALEYAHRPPRMAHGAIRLANLMITRHGRVKVLEFGVASIVREALSRHAMPGGGIDLHGSMSPHVAAGGAPGPLDDVYSFGAAIFELLTGAPPFCNASRLGLLDQIAHDPAPSMQTRREQLGLSGRAQLPDSWEFAVRACLAKEPGMRPASAREVLNILEGRCVPKRVAISQAAPVPREVQEAHVSKDQRNPAATRSPEAPRPAKRRLQWRALAIALGFAMAAAVVVSTQGPPDIALEPAAPADAPRSGADAPAPAPAAEPIRASASPVFVNSLGMPFAQVPGTKVLFCSWETRVQDYQAFADDTGRPVFPPAFHQGLDHPAVNISWDDAVAFCQWLSEKEGRTYRLPGDHEWSTAAELSGREEAGIPPVSKHTLVRDFWPWGAQWPPRPGAGNYAGEESDFSARIAGYRDEWKFTAPVGRFPANRFGLHDLGGNAWEWCADWWDENHTYRVLRGGAFNLEDSISLLASYRHFVTPHSRFSTHGFRVVLEY
jgi:serine/threonine protein kinase